MKRQTRQSSHDISIHNDELEQGRRMLEIRLKNSMREPSLSLSSDNEVHRDNDRYNRAQQPDNRRPHRAPASRKAAHDDDDSSLELGRHDNGSIPYPEFPSFAHRSGDYVEGDSQMQAWSFRTTEDDEGVNPYQPPSPSYRNMQYLDEDTMSTTHHHASGVTITTGLAGTRARRGHGNSNSSRGDLSMSNAEYDPERPIGRIIQGVGRMSMFDETKSKANVNSTTFEPLVVDSTAELDRILQSGYAPGSTPQSQHDFSIHPTPPLSQASSSSSDSDSHLQSPSRKTRLADALASRNVPFSPKRPRGGLAAGSAMQSNPPVNMTPRPAKRTVGGAAAVHRPRAAPQPEVRLQPPTPSNSTGVSTGVTSGASSKFTRMARGIARDINEELHRPPPARKVQETPQRKLASSMRRPKDQSMNKSGPGLHLPDVTGLTVALESPAKIGKEYYDYPKSRAAREVEIRLVQTLSAVQSKLAHLNEENSISRRRVRELELELEECKRDVVRERTLLLEREVKMMEKEKDLLTATKARKSRVDEAESSRYKEAVEEKKALEALINSLRTHLTRLTSELASHQELLGELRDLQTSNSNTLEEHARKLEGNALTLEQKEREITDLNEEVERLAGEVEVLRGVVEEGLRERRAGRTVRAGATRRVEEPTVEMDEADLSMSQDLDEESEAEETEEEVPQRGQRVDRRARIEEESEPEQEENGESSFEEDESAAPQIIESSARRRDRDGDRTDLATLGSNNNSRFAGVGTSPWTPLRTGSSFRHPQASTPYRVQFVDQSELDEISREVEERRNDASREEDVRRAKDKDAGDKDARDEERRRAFEASLSYVDIEPPRSRPRSPVPPPTPTPASKFLGGGWSSQAQTQQPPRRPSTSSAQPPTKKSTLASSSKTKSTVPASKVSSSKAPAADGVVETPFPQIRGERLERLFFSAPEHNPKTCTVCFRREQRDPVRNTYGSAPQPTAMASAKPSSYSTRAAPQQRFDEEEDEDVDEGFGDELDAPVALNSSAYRSAASKAGVPPQTVVMRVVRDLEDDFTHYKSVYVELADQYKDMDPVSDVARRNLVAKHLKEVVDVLEQKGDQIASLYELIQFKERPLAESKVPSTRRL